MTMQTKQRTVRSGESPTIRINAWSSRLGTQWISGSYFRRSASIVMMAVIWLAAPPAPSTCAAAFVLMQASEGSEAPAKAEEKSPTDDLNKRLIRKATSDEEEDLMTGLARMMGEAANRLDLEFDAGAQTQGVQDRIMQGLEQAIQAAAAQTRQKKSKPSPSKGDQRTSPKSGATKGGETPTDPTESGESSESKGSAAKPGAAPMPSAVTALEESRRGWGNLPSRDRDEVIQGVGENFLERYRAWVEKYYRALQDSE